MVDTGLCKKVNIRFAALMPVVDPKDAAAQIISAQRKGLEEVSIPRYLLHLNKFIRIFPNASAKHFKDFATAYVESDA
jgi:all-trans-retinol dehydrogenase (NAD+)